MTVVAGSSSPQENPSPQNSSAQELLFAVVASVVDFRRAQARKELLSGVQARHGSESYQASQATADKILDLVQRNPIPREGVAFISSLLASVPSDRPEANLLVFRVAQALIEQSPMAHEWVLLESLARGQGGAVAEISDRRMTWAANELHRQMGQSCYETRIGALPAMLAFLRLQGLLSLERVSEAAALLAARAKAAANPQEVLFCGRDVLELASIHEQVSNPGAVPTSIAETIVRTFKNDIGVTTDLKTTEFTLQRLAVAFRTVSSLTELYRSQSYQTKGWDQGAAAAGIAEFLKTSGLTKQAALTYEFLVCEMVKQQRQVGPLLPLLAYVATRAGDQSQTEQFVSIMETFRKDAFGGPAEDIPQALYPYFIQPQKPHISHDFIRIAIKIYECQGQQSDAIALPEYLSNVARYLHDLRTLNASPVILTGLRRAIERGSIPSATEMDKLMRHLVSHAALSVLISAATPEEHREAGNKLNAYYKNDSPPFAYRPDRVDAQAQTFLDETFRVIRRALDHMNGFGAHEFEARRPSRSGQSALEEFFRDSGAHVQRLNSSANDRFPGAGFMISGVNPERFLVADKRNAQDPFWQYRAAWPWVGTVISDLEGSTLISSRGFYAVIPPGTNRYCLHSQHYSYVVFNSHFENAAQHGALLVPTRILMEQLDGGIIPVEEYRGFSSQHRDLCKSGLTPNALSELGENARIPVLHLSWPSNVGGLMRAFPPNRPPYHQWELGRMTPYRDVAGHVHHSFIEGSYNPRLNSPGLKSQLDPLIQAHGMVRDLSDSLQALFTLFQYAEAAHSKGQFLPPDEAPQQDEPHQDDEPEEGDAQMNPQAARKIRQSLEWYRRGQGSNHPRDSFPILAIVPSAQLCPSPGQITPILDTVDFSTVVDGKKRYLLKEFDRERDSWERPSDEELSRAILGKLTELHPQVAEVYTRMGIRMRLLHRDLVYQSKKPEGGDRHAQSSAST